MGEIWAPDLGSPAPYKPSATLEEARAAFAKASIELQKYERSTAEGALVGFARTAGDLAVKAIESLEQVVSQERIAAEARRDTEARRSDDTRRLQNIGLAFGLFFAFVAAVGTAAQAWAAVKALPPQSAHAAPERTP